MAESTRSPIGTLGALACDGDEIPKKPERQTMTYSRWINLPSPRVRLPRMRPRSVQAAEMLRYLDNRADGFGDLLSVDCVEELCRRGVADDTRVFESYAGSLIVSSLGRAVIMPVVEELSDLGLIVRVVRGGKTQGGEAHITVDGLATLDSWDDTKSPSPFWDRRQSK